LTATVKGLMKSGDEKDGADAGKPQDLAQQVDANSDGTITMAEVEAIPDEGLKFGDNTYSRDDMVEVFRKIASLNRESELPDDEIALTRAQWLDAQSKRWKPIWLWPSGVLAVLLGVFAVAFHDKPAEKKAD
jgi:hypothetical protein